MTGLTESEQGNSDHNVESVGGLSGSLTQGVRDAFGSVSNKALKSHEIVIYTGMFFHTEESVSASLYDIVREGMPVPDAPRTDTEDGQRRKWHDWDKHKSYNIIIREVGENPQRDYAFSPTDTVSKITLENRWNKRPGEDPIDVLSAIFEHAYDDQAFKDKIVSALKDVEFEGKHARFEGPEWFDRFKEGDLAMKTGKTEPVNQYDHKRKSLYMETNHPEIVVTICEESFRDVAKRLPQMNWFSKMMLGKTDGSTVSAGIGQEKQNEIEASPVQHLTND